MAYLIKCYGKISVVITAVFGHSLFIFALDPEDIFAPAFGPVVVLPHLELSASYEDNIFLSSDNSNKSSDYSTMVSPGFGLQYGENLLDSNYLRLDYLSDIKSYIDNTELNSNNHLFSFGINYAKEGKFTFSGTDQIRLGNSLLQGRETYFFEALDAGLNSTKGLLIERLSSEDAYRFEYEISPKTSIYAAISLSMVDFEDGAHYYYKSVFGDLIPYSLYDVSSWGNNIGFGWQAFPKVKLYGSFTYGITNVDKNLESMQMRPDSDFFGGNILAQGVFSEKIIGSIQLGYQTREFDRLSNGFSGDKHNLPIFNVSLGYEYSEKGSVSFGYKRGGNVSVEQPGTGVVSDFLTLSISQDLGIARKFNLSFKSRLQMNTYENTNGLAYDFSELDFGVSYRFNQWMRSSLVYGFDYFNADKGNIDYRLNSVMLALSLGY